jgi:protein SCO1/2
VDVSASLFDHSWVWNDEHGGAVRFSEWRGKLLVVSLVYTTCTTVCPLAIEKMRQVSATLDREGRAAEYVLVTLDPTNDTSEQLRLFREARGLPNRWHLLRGSPEQTDELATFLRLKILNTGDHVFHEARLVFLDSSGRVMGQIRG